MSLHVDTFQVEVYNAFVETIRRRLKVKVLEAIDKDIDATVEEAVKSLKLGMEYYQDPFMGRGIIEVILKKS